MQSRDKEKKELITRIMDPKGNPGPAKSGNKAIRKRRWRKIGIGVAAVIVIGVSTYYYNKFVNLTQEVRDARAKIEAALQLRENVVPALVMTITDFITHENEVFIHAADVRAKSVGGVSKSNPGSSDWDGLLSKLFAIAERYPELKTGEPFQLLMSKIADAEMEIFKKRVEYNTKVRHYNMRISTFPANIFSAIFRVKSEPYFQWKGKPEWVSTLDESRRSRTGEILEKWRARLLPEE